MKEKDNGKLRYDDETGNDEWTSDQFYEINQNNPIIISKQNNKYIKIMCDNNTYEQEGKNNSSNTSTKQINTLSILCNYGLKPIYTFINKCTKEWEEDKKKDKRRYMYTYLGLNNQKKPIYEQHEFIPYAHFDGLVGQTAKDVREDFRFFTSEEGESWHKQRNLPYQLTHCYYGDPGTGKSIIACAVAQKHNLHIVRIRLSDIKDNQEFVKVIRNKRYSENTLEYKDILYLFDEFDTELEKLAKNSSTDTDKEIRDAKKRQKSIKATIQAQSNNIKNNIHNNNIGNNYYDSNLDSGDDNDIDDDDDDDGDDKVGDDDLKNLIEDIKDSDDVDKSNLLKQLAKVQTCLYKKSDSTASNLSIGVILEELNGINQMYGRKMIIITNKIDVLKTIHKGAFVRPGRIDRMCELKRMTRKDVRDLLNIYYPEKQNQLMVTSKLMKSISNYVYTPAYITNICKISKTPRNFIENLNIYDNKD